MAMQNRHLSTASDIDNYRQKDAMASTEISLGNGCLAVERRARKEWYISQGKVRGSAAMINTGNESTEVRAGETRQRIMQLRTPRGIPNEAREQSWKNPHGGNFLPNF